MSPRFDSGPCKPRRFITSPLLCTISPHAEDRSIADRTQGLLCLTEVIGRRARRVRRGRPSSASTPDVGVCRVPRTSSRLQSIGAQPWTLGSLPMERPGVEPGSSAHRRFSVQLPPLEVQTHSGCPRRCHVAGPSGTWGCSGDGGNRTRVRPVGRRCLSPPNRQCTTDGASGNRTRAATVLSVWVATGQTGPWCREEIRAPAPTPGTVPHLAATSSDRAEVFED